MMKSLHLRANCAAALAAGVLLAGCSSTPEAPKTTASAEAPAAATTDTTPPAANADGSFPDVNTVPTERPTSTIQDLNQAPEGLSGAEGGTQYGEELVGGPTASADRPPPPPEPEPEAAPSSADLPPIPEPGITETSDAPASEPAAAPEPVAQAAPEPEPEPEVAAAEPTPDPATVESAPLAPMDGAASAQPVTPVGTPQPGATPFQPDAQLALTPGSVQTQSVTVQPQAQSASYGPNYNALAPESYGITFPQPALPSYQPYNAQAMYRSPYAAPPTNYGGAEIVGVQPPLPAPGLAYGQPGYGQLGYGQPVYGQTVYGQAAYAQPYAGGQPVGLVYFRDGSARLSSDDRKVLKQIAELQKSYGGVIRVIGHASMRTGSMDMAQHLQANQHISEARASAVAKQLIRYGVPSGAIQTSAAGDTQPIYAEVMPTGEAANRRAEVYLSAY